jgi:hypothetical protein
MQFPFAITIGALLQSYCKRRHSFISVSISKRLVDTKLPTKGEIHTKGKQNSGTAKKNTVDSGYLQWQNMFYSPVRANSTKAAGILGEVPFYGHQQYVSSNTLRWTAAL